ncbi:DUF695 domain-containing protein [Arthrobacter burdickii]|uniref:DUF695 domain-containing protein n=1 Tax=Arthrobacter burdickii TaxID=3035920 RepID=A0ABT8JYV8_9MICC|nr:DUF695 domain-containing protein [Arthrobacter burdickii]MDN4610359.1 DUF695 domain-containing protein [Arthrobacter burdickii]
MGIFRRRAAAGRRIGRGIGRDPIADFWQWWADDGEDLLTTATRAGDFDAYVDVMTTRVKAIARGLEWETRTGTEAEHTLCVSSGGNPSLRPVAERWYRASPPASRRWEFVPARSAKPDMLESTITYRGRSFDLRRTRIHTSLTRAGDGFIVSVHNPGFTGQWDDEHGLCVLMLEWLLGEDDVERWVRRVDCIVHDVVDSIPAADLPARVAELARTAPEPGWLLMEGKLGSGHPILVRVLRPLRWIDHPNFDLHSGLRVAFDADERGLPRPAVLAELDDLEDGLVQALGQRGMLVAAETSKGARTFHFYSDSEDQNGRDVFDTAARGRRSVTARHTLDPGWRKVQDFA